MFTIINITFIIIIIIIIINILNLTFLLTCSLTHILICIHIESLFNHNEDIIEA